MRRSFVAFGVAIAAIVVAIVLLLRAPRQTVTPPPERVEPPSKPTTELPVEKPKEPAAEPEPKVKAKEPVTPPTPVESVVDADAVLKDADAKEAAGKTLEAYKALSDALLRGPKAKRGEELRARLTKLSDAVFFSDKVVAPHAINHQVVRGDSLIKLATAHKTTIELVRRLNGLKGTTLRLGQRLKIVPGGFDVAVDKSDFRLTVTKDGLWVREFRIGLGKNGTTPIGGYVAGEKLPEPAYTRVFPHVPFGDKKRNPLGTRWITIQGDYGIHGTWEPQSVGKEESEGCVRMLNQDVEWLYDLIVKGSSKIAIRP
ncbi:MAG: LysM peptidoglycan-binding domain-containing protein [Planctomycetes bacterium]|nr:LysM peptidoglycan-binding domain-containing protein [Planctomycetota bacterium]